MSAQKITGLKLLSCCAVFNESNTIVLYNTLIIEVSQTPNLKFIISMKAKPPKNSSINNKTRENPIVNAFPFLKTLGDVQQLSENSIVNAEPQLFNSLKTLSCQTTQNQQYDSSQSNSNLYKLQRTKIPLKSSENTIQSINTACKHK